MPFRIKQISPRRYQVYNKLTGHVYSYSTTLPLAKKQLRLLYIITHGKGYL
jgi:hypothetical protein